MLNIFSSYTTNPTLLQTIMLLIKYLFPGSFTHTAIIDLSQLSLYVDKLFPTLRHLLNSLVMKELPNVLINIKAGHVEQDSGIDPVLLRHLGIVLVEDLLEEGERYLHIGLES